MPNFMDILYISYMKSSSQFRACVTKSLAFCVLRRERSLKKAWMIIIFYNIYYCQICSACSLVIWFTEAEWRIYASVKYTNIVSDNGLSPVCHQAIQWSKSTILSIGCQVTCFDWILFQIQKFSLKRYSRKCFLQNVSHFISVLMCRSCMPCCNICYNLSFISPQ